jgi:hypothetical protein
MKIHPIAEMFPMMTDEELSELAEDIKTNGLLNPITKDKDGVLIDGRNRLEACKRAGVEPTFETLNGTDPIAYILAQNVKRRQLNKGQQAMIVAFAYPEPEKGGRGKRGNLLETSGFSRQRLGQARQVLRHSKELAEAVLNDTIKLDKAIERMVEQKREMESIEAKLEILRKDAPDLAELVNDERLNLPEAYASLEERKRIAVEEEKSQRETFCRIGETTYSGILAWAVDEFCSDLEKRLEDEEFRESFIKRIRLNRAEIPSVLKGAEAFTHILKKI